LLRRRGGGGGGGGDCYSERGGERERSLSSVRARTEYEEDFVGTPSLAFTAPLAVSAPFISPLIVSVFYDSRIIT